MAHKNDVRRPERDRVNGKYRASRKRFATLSAPEPTPQESTTGAVAAPPPALTPEADGETFAAEVRDSNGEARRVIVTPPTRGARYLRSSMPQRRIEPGTGAVEAHEPLSALDIESDHRSLWQRAREILIGAPIPTEKASHERIGKAKALAVLSSDALSSVAYGSEASLAILALAGISFFAINIGIGLAIIALLAIVAFSYRQTIKHYPTGGGSYIVARAHLGVNAGLIAAAALLLDYILTVSVSVSAGVDAIISAFGSLSPFAVLIGVLFIALIVLLNLRGVREAGTIFAVPTYLFVGSYLLTIGIGLARAILSGGLFNAATPVITKITPPHPEQLSIFLILTAFASGCSAMTGTEAIADGVPIFRGETPREQSQNAAGTLTIMACLLAIMFGGTTYLAWRFGISPQPNSHPTVLSQLAALIWGHGAFGTIFFYLFQFATTLILTLAANTSFSDFPRLSSILARDDFMPHFFGLRGSRLAFNTGIIVLGVLSSLLLIIFGGNTDALINLYALGVFTAFTLSQSGMVGRWRAQKEPGWRKGVVISTIGAIATGIVTVIIVISKTPRGAWVILVLVPLIVLMFRGIHRHYAKASEIIAEMPVRKPGEIRHLMIVPVASLNKLALRGLSYARSITPHVIAVHVALDPSDKVQIWHDWDEMVKSKKFLRGGPLPENDLDDSDIVPTAPQLIVIDSPYRVLGRPVINYIDKLHREFPDDMITVVLPEFVATHFWEHLLHNQTTLFLKFALLTRSDVVTANVPYRFDEKHDIHHSITK